RSDKFLSHAIAGFDVTWHCHLNTVMSAKSPGDAFHNVHSCTKHELRCTNVDQKLKNITLSQHSGAYPGMA
ncbi:hypothetical protein J4X29_19375, partial [Escherichia coli]